jgi:hypothetical protein
VSGAEADTGVGVKRFGDSEVGEFLNALINIWSFVGLDSSVRR